MGQLYGSEPSGIDIVAPDLHFGIMRDDPWPGGNEKAEKADWVSRGARTWRFRGALFFVPSEDVGMAYHSDHLIFNFRHKGRGYLASLHTSGGVATTVDEVRLAGLVRSLSSVGRLPRDNGVERGTSRMAADDPTALGVARSGAWVASYGGQLVWTIDRRLRTTARFRLPSNPWPRAIAVVAGDAWIAQFGRGVTRFSASHGEKSRQFFRVGTDPVDVVSVGDEVWVLHQDSRSISIIHPNDEVERAVVTFPTKPAAMTARKRRVWVVSCDGTLYTLDAVTRRIIHEVDAGRELLDVAVGRNVWVSDWMTGSIVNAGPAGKEVLHRMNVGTAPTQLAVADGTVWVMDSLEESIVGIRERSGVRTRVDATLSAPVELGVHGTHIWVIDSKGLVRIQVPLIREARPRRTASLLPASVSDGRPLALDPPRPLSCRTVGATWRPLRRAGVCLRFGEE